MDAETVNLCFRFRKTRDKESALVRDARPKSTKYKDMGNGNFSRMAKYENRFGSWKRFTRLPLSSYV